MANEAWLNGKLDGYAPILIPAAHALTQAIADLEKHAPHLSDEELLIRPNNSPSAAFHLRHIAGSIDRLLTYSRDEELSEAQFEFLKKESSPNSALNASELTRKAIDEINRALDHLKNIAPESLFEERFVGRKRLLTNVFGLLFHIAEHTARHVGQVITIARIVWKEKTN
ncbi:MAG TPA: DinB family protein [Pyrinomonadaceae bacterium]|nr:DinB family protein [Pyrinomonadaceae bacterium]